ncbi:MAG: phage tail assembly chaperone [Alphaproteobacteria bacterium]|nr:phage tail assembly chaperone [Alphaproteobacteria bacterium]
MAAGLGLLGIPPPTFWAMTPRELEAAIKGRLGQSAPLTAPRRHELTNLMKKFPDPESANG